jgi:exosortase
MRPASDHEARRGSAAASVPSIPVPVAVPARGQPIAVGVRAPAFLALLGLSIAWLWEPLSTVIVVSLRYNQEHYSHIVLIPLVAAGLMYLDRRVIFARVAYASGLGGLLMTAGVALSWVAHMGPVTDPAQNYVSLALLALVVLWAGAFLLCFGPSALRAAAFPMAFLLLMVPIPPRLIHQVITFLQWASAETTYVLFNLLGVPVYRDGFFFTLPGLAIEVAEECSGIRSFLALVITSLLGGHLLLRTAWTRTSLLLAMLPLAIVKNAVRIVVLSLLAIHVDRGFITGSLHRTGGIPLFFVSLLLMGGLVWLLQRAEARFRRPTAQ